MTPLMQPALDLSKEALGVATAKGAQLRRDRLGREGRGEGKARIKRDDVGALKGPQARAPRATKPLREARPFTVAVCHTTPAGLLEDGPY